MKPLLPLVLTGLFAFPLFAEDTADTQNSDVFDSVETKDLSQFVWKKRPVVVFADNEADPRFIEQLELLREGEADLADRDVVVLLDTDPDAKSDLRLKLRPRGFMLAIIGKDGGIKLRKPFPWDVREITRSIDKMPMRKREVREQKEAAATDG
ncbi:hypothetical protein ASD8599_02844 [Ascidiaceihabitans donghaensis]|uniref:DUF4174 domain-containing protein n=1 Tax=Ascidiaceihabitans donghaensis TaxID=1510460 RepID=A0A2R8BGA3_9RHOB|nr:DUF4174 domain-containing protein [Ascidiaceihabitans donghaensis]SPH22099.1 hypothetical protein ASD8599_02844 [Ascidiaceihabitans donghaensis]